MRVLRIPFVLQLPSEDLRARIRKRWIRDFTKACSTFQAESAVELVACERIRPDDGVDDSSVFVFGCRFLYIVRYERERMKANAAEILESLSRRDTTGIQVC
jgi:hypothetical protein